MMITPRTIVIISFALIAGVFAWIGFEMFLKSPIKTPQTNIVEKSNTNPTQPIKIPTEDELLKDIKELPDNQIDLGLASLVIAKDIYPDININAYMEKLDSMAKELKGNVGNTKDPAKVLNIVNNYINQHRAAKIYSISDDEEALYGSFLNTVLDKTSGNCLGYSTLYLFLGERLGIPLYGVILPLHIFVKYDDGKYQKEIESTNGQDFPWLAYIMQLNARNIVAYKGDWQYHKTTKTTKKEVVSYMLNNRGAIRRTENNYAAAIDDYTKAIEITPGFALAYFNRGDTKAEKGDLDGAITDYTKAIEIIPDYTRAYFNRASAKFQKGDYDGTIADYTKAIEVTPDLSGAYCNRGFAKFQKGDIDGAIADYNKAIKIKPGYAEAYYGRGLANAKKGNESDAIADYTKAIEIRPDFAEAYYNRGFARAKIGNLNDAITDYNKSIKINPNFANAYYGRGLANAKKGNENDAIADYTRAIEIRPDFVAAYIDRGDLKLKNNYLEDAINDYNKAIEIMPNSDVVYVSRGYAKYRKRDYNGAISDWEQAIRLNPSGEKEIKQWIQGAQFVKELEKELEKK